MTTPYISIVATTRNDGYGENMQQRLDMFIKSLDYHAAKYPDLFELVMVEWNPPEDRAPLHTILHKCQHLKIRVITVPKECHDTLEFKTPMSEYSAKNVGIKRSRGKFILITNPDIIMTEPLVAVLATQNLKEDRIYRVDRYDFTGDGIADIHPSAYTHFAVMNTFQFHGIYKDTSLLMTVDKTQRPSLPVSKVDRMVIHCNAAGDFMLATRESFEHIRGLYEGTELSGSSDGISMIRFVGMGIQQNIFAAPASIFHHDHTRTRSGSDWDRDPVIAMAQHYVCPNWGFPDQVFEEWTNQGYTPT